MSLQQFLIKAMLGVNANIIAEKNQNIIILYFQV